MRYPPAITFTPGASWVYRAVASLFATILIALGAVYTAANGGFSFKNSAFAALALLSAAWLMRDAWMRQVGSLRYAQGQWSWVCGDEDVSGTCAIHLDLQRYILVSFTAHSNHNKLFNRGSKWFHLEARSEDPAAGRLAWLALRRALYAPVASLEDGSAEFSPEDLAHEKRRG